MAVKLIAMPICTGAGYWLAGFGGLIVGFTVAELLRYGVTLVALREEKLPVLRYDLVLTLGIALTWVVTTQVGNLVATSNRSAIPLIVEVSTVIAIWLGLAGIARWWLSGTAIAASGGTRTPWAGLRGRWSPTVRPTGIRYGSTLRRDRANPTLLQIPRHCSAPIDFLLSGTTMHLIVHAILIVWLLIVPWACSWRVPRHLVVAAAFLFGLLFLPMVDEFGEIGKPDRGGPFAAIMLPGLALTKLKVTSLAVLLGVLVTDLKRLLQFRPSWFDLPMVLWCLSPLPSLIGAPPPEGKDPFQMIVAQCFGMFLVWGVPFFMGRLYFDSLPRLRDLALLFAASALVYVPFCLYEMRMSPVLHTRIYGFAQHEFQQSIRLGGYRPVVFMQHGLAVGLFMVTGTLIGIVLWWSGATKNLLSSRWPRLARYSPYLLLLLAVTTILTRSTGALVLGAVGLVALALAAWPRTRLPLLGLCLASALYVGTRSSGSWSGYSLVPVLTETLGDERAQSFVFRQINEDQLIDKAFEAPPSAGAAGVATWYTIRMAMSPPLSMACGSSSSGKEDYRDSLSSGRPCFSRLVASSGRSRCPPG